jgi:hypothetical protein
MTDTKALLELAARCEAATASEQREMLELAFRAIHGEKPTRVHGGCDLLDFWLARHNPFFLMLEAKAFESAALMLVPEGWTRLTDNTDGREIVELYTPDYDEHDWQPDIRFSAASAATPALALCAASLRAIAQEQSK